ncbi:hypothetical protein D3C81_1845330 [compost metagenome]
MVAEAQVGVDHEVHTAHAKVVSLGRAAETPVLIDQAHGLCVGIVTLGGAVDLRVGESQAIQLFGGEHTALEGLRQDASGAGGDGRVLEQLGADLQFGLRQPRLGGDAELAVLVRGATVVADRQQASAAAARA